MPKITPHLGQPVEIIVGDAYAVVPKMHADVALIDIFPDYGGNSFNVHCPNIAAIWCWGSSSTSGGGSWW
jgi:hypothetical protein